MKGKQILQRGYMLLAVLISLLLAEWSAARYPGTAAEFAGGKEDPGSKSKGTIYLTFDDGPGPYTDELLDILRKNDVKATFFVTDSGCLEMVQRIHREGHAVGCHSASHRYSEIYRSEEDYFRDLDAIRSAVAEYTGQQPVLLRFPGGSSNTVSRQYSKGIMTRLTKAVSEQGMVYFDWNVDSKDMAGAKTADRVYRNVVREIGKQNVSVVLQHDTLKYSIEAVEKIIQWGKANGYQFLPLTPESPLCRHTVVN